MFKLHKQNGISILGVLVLGVIVILILSYFGVSIRAVVESPEGQDNITYVRGGARSLWTDYLAEPVHNFWNNVWIPVFWEPFVSNMERLRDGEPTDIEEAANDLMLQQ